MKIVISPEIFNNQQYGGISRYFVDVISNLNRIDYDIYIPHTFHRNYHLKDFTNNGKVRTGMFLNYNRCFKLFNSLINYYLTTVQVAKIKEKFIYHSTYYSLPNKSNIYARKVITVYDMIHENLGKKYNFSDYEKLVKIKKKAIFNSDHIIAISNATKENILKYYNIPDQKISVIGLNATNEFLSNRLNFNNKKNHILYVGNRSYYKNFDLLLKILPTLTLNNNLVLNVYGGEDPTPNEVKFINKHNLKKNIKFIQGDSKVLFGLYQSSKCMIFPSLEEGFGIPIMEAISAGCIPICSNIPVFREIGRNLIEYFDVNNPASLISKINDVLLYDEDTYMKSISKLRDLMNIYSVDRMVNETALIYKNIL